MPGSLNHPPAKVVIAYLIDQALVAKPAAGASWPCYYGDEPDTPDNCVTIYDTDGRLSGREHVGGEMQGSHGIQVRLRCGPSQILAGYQKLMAISQNFDTAVNRTLVPLGNDTYRIQSISRTSDILSLGREDTASARRIYVFNALVSLRLLPGTGSY